LKNVQEIINTLGKFVLSR